MKKLSIILTVLVIFAFVICNVNFNVVEAANKSYVALGDSIPAGYGLNTTSERYTNILANKIGMSLRNLAVSGHKTADLLNVIKNQTSLSYIKNADLITVSIGGNDMINSLDSILSALGGNDEIFSECENNLKQITNYLKANTKKDCIIIYQNIANCYKYTIYGAFVNSAINRLNGLISKQCDGNKVYYCNIATSLEQSGDNFFATQGGDYALDPHPTAKGHKIIANEMYNTYSSIISQRPQETSTETSTETTQIIQTSTNQTTYETTSQIIETSIQIIETLETTSSIETTNQTNETTNSPGTTTSEQTFLPTTDTTYIETTVTQETGIPIIETTTIIETSKIVIETTESLETSNIIETTNLETTFEETTSINETTFNETSIETTIVTQSETIEETTHFETQETTQENSNTTKEETMVIYTESSKPINNEKQKSNIIIYIILAVLIGGGSFVVVFIFKKQKEQ